MFDNVEVLDFAGPYEVFTTAARVHGRTHTTEAPCFELFTGAFLLAKAGLLDTKLATTHWEDVDDLKTMFPAVTVRSGVRWIDEGSVVTSAGISAGIDMSLHLVERVASRELALRTARQMEFDWTDS